MSHGSAGPDLEPAERSLGDQLLGLALAFGLIGGSWLLFQAVERVVEQRPAVIQAARLGSLQPVGLGWGIAAFFVTLAAAIACLAVFGLQLHVAHGRPLGLASRRWRWPVFAASVVAILAVDLGYLALEGRQAVYVNATERGIVNSAGVRRQRWDQASAARLACEVVHAKQSDAAKVTFDIAFADNSWISLGRPVGKGFATRWFDIAIPAADAIRAEQRAEPGKTILRLEPDPGCAQLVAGQPGDVQAKFARLFAPLGR